DSGTRYVLRRFHNLFFFSSRRRHTRSDRDWSSDVCSSDLFFFISQEYYRQLVPQAASVNILVPTAAERGGDFSRSVDGSGRAITIVDPNTGSPFPGNVVPANRIYAPGKSILNFLPAANTTAGGSVYNYT